jgi:hypothetical protein
MAERFGGKYSPDGAQKSDPPGGQPFDGKRRSRAGGRVNLLFFVPIMFVFSAFGQEPLGLGIDLAAFGTLVLAAWLTREGVLAQEAYDARKVARRPAIPRKIFASILTGVGLFLGGYVPGGSLLDPAIFAVLGAILHAFAFGPDPLKDKGMEGIDSFQTDRVARAVDEAEKHLAAMKDAILRAADRGLETRVDKFAATARAMFRTVENDPRDLTAARKYLSVYLLGARDATIKFADIYARGRDPKARLDYEALLHDLETNFAAQTQNFLTDDRSDLTVEIDVLRERLQREGVKPE